MYIHLYAVNTETLQTPLYYSLLALDTCVTAEAQNWTDLNCSP